MKMTNLNKKNRYMPFLMALCVVIGIIIGSFFSNHFAGNRLNIDLHMGAWFESTAKRFWHRGARWTLLAENRLGQQHDHQHDGPLCDARGHVAPPPYTRLRPRKAISLSGRGPLSLSSPGSPGPSSSLRSGAAPRISYCRYGEARSVPSGSVEKNVR